MKINRKIGTPKIKKDLEAAARIKALRGSLTQAGFAELLHVAQPMVSAWEAGRELPSSADLWIKFGELAGYPDCYWFWERAGLNRQKLLTATEQMLKDQIKDAGSPLLTDRIVLVPRVRKTSHGLEPTGIPLLMPAEAVLNRLSTYCFVLESAQVVVDTSDATAPNFLPFYNQMILAEFSPGQDFDERLMWPNGLHVGVLYLGNRVTEIGMVRERTEFFWMAGNVCFSLLVGLYQEKFKTREPSQELDNQPIATLEEVRRDYRSRNEARFPRLLNETEEQWWARVKPITNKEAIDRLASSPEFAAQMAESMSWPFRRLKLIAAESYFAPEFKIIGRVIAQLPLPATKGKK